MYGKSMYARVGYIQQNEVQCNFVPIVYTSSNTYLRNWMDLSIMWYAEVNQNITKDYVVFDCELHFARDSKISFVIESHLLNF